MTDWISLGRQALKVKAQERHVAEELERMAQATTVTVAMLQAYAEAAVFLDGLPAGLSEAAARLAPLRLQVLARWARHDQAGAERLVNVALSRDIPLRHLRAAERLSRGLEPGEAGETAAAGLLAEAGLQVRVDALAAALSRGFFLAPTADARPLSLGMPGWQVASGLWRRRHTRAVLPEEDDARRSDRAYAVAIGVDRHGGPALRRFVPDLLLRAHGLRQVSEEVLLILPNMSAAHSFADVDLGGDFAQGANGVFWLVPLDDGDRRR